MDAVDKLTFDASGLQKGAADATAALEKIDRAAKSVAKVFSPIADAADKASRRIVTGSSDQAKFLDSLTRKYDPLSQAVRQAERDFNRLSGIMAAGGENAQRAAEQIGAVSRRLQEAQRAAASVSLDNAFKGIGRAADEAARQSSVAWSNMGAAIGAAARQAASESNQAWSNLAHGIADATRAAVAEQRAFSDAVSRVDAVLEQSERAAQRRVDAFWQEAAARQAVIQAARAQQVAETAQSNINAQLGVQTPRSGSARASASVFTDAFAEAERAAREADAMWENLSRGIAGAARESQSIRSRFESIAGSLDPAIAATMRLAQLERDLDLAVATGITTQRERNRLLAEANKISSSGATSTGGLSAAQRAALPAQLQFQANDIVGGLLTGQRPMTVFLQQAPQVSQALGGWGAALRAIVSPAGLATTAIIAFVAAAGAIIARAASLESASRQIGVALRTMGGAAGLSAASVQSIIDRQSSQPGFGRADTTAAARQVLGNRNIRGGDVGDTLDLARNLALVNGQELPAALDALLPKLTSGASGLRQLDEQYGILTADQLRYIDTLDRQGRQQDITRIGLDAMTARFKGEGVKAMSEWGKAIDQAAKGFDDFVTGIAKSPQAQAALAYLKLTAELIERGGRVARGPAAPSLDEQGIDLQKRLDDLNRQFNNSVANNGTRNIQLPGIMKEMQEVGDAIDKVNAAKFSREIDQVIAEAIRMGQAIEDDKKKTDALIDRFNPLGKAAREAAADMETLALALAKATDPDKARQLEDALRSVGQAAYQATQTPIDQAGQARRVATDLANLPRTQRALEEARRRAVDEYAGASGEMKRRLDAQGGVAALIKEYQGRVTEELRGQIRDLMEDIDAAAKHSLEIARAYGKGLKEGYLADVKAAVDDMIRTGPATEGQRAELMRQKLQQEAGQAIGNLGRQNGALLPQVEAAERMADAEERGAAAVREASIANQVYLGTYEARARAELANSPQITAEYEKQKAILTDLIKRQSDAQRITEAIALNRQFNPAAQFASDVAKLNDLAATGKVTAEAYQRAWTEAYIRMGTASDSWLSGATAGLLEYARQAQAVGGAVASAIVTAFGAADDAIAKLLLRRSVDMRQFLADISLDLTRAFVRQSITGPIAGFLGSLFTGGPQTAGQQSSVYTGGGALGVSGLMGGGSNPLGMLSGGGFNPFGMFGRGGSLGTFLQTPLFGTGGVFGSSLASGGSSLGGILGGSGGVGGGLTLGSGLGALAGIGSSIFSFASGNPIGGVTGLLGAGLSLIPGVGQVLGPVVGILGSILGGLFKSKPDIKAQGWHDFDVTTGRYTGGQTFAQGVAAPIAPGVGNDALKLIEAFGGKAITSPEYYIWRGFDDGRMDATVTAEGSPTYARLLQEAFAGGAQGIDQAQWAARKKLWTDAGDVDLPIGDLTKDSEKLMQQLALLILKAGVRDNDYTGLTDTSKSIIRNFPTADTQGLGQALQWGKETYDVLLRGDTLTNAEKAITGLKDSFQAAILKAKEYALATDGLVEAQSNAIKKVATDFNQSIGDRILGLTDPAALQRVQLDREFDQLRKEAEYLNSDAVQSLTGTLVDINELERAYGLQREQIVSQQLDGLLDLQKRLLYGDLSGATPGATVAGTQASFEATLAQARAGSTDALGRLSGVGADYVSSLQSAYGNTERFASGRDAVLNAIAGFINPGTAATGGAANFNSASAEQWGVLVAAFQAQSAQIATLLESQARLTAAFDRAA